MNGENLIRACPKCRVRLDVRWSFSLCPKCGRKYAPEEFELIPEEQLAEGKFRLYQAIYLDGYRDLQPSPSTISLREKNFEFLIGEAENRVAIERGYDAIQSLNLLQEREITALRTFLMGPTFAALLKKNTRTLTIGFRDELGLMQTLAFKMTEEDLEACYEKMMNRIRKLKGLPEEHVMPVCEVCGERMSLLDEKQGRWYCFKDDTLYLETSR
jgi:hypothetical protein